MNGDIGAAVTTEWLRETAEWLSADVGTLWLAAFCAVMLPLTLLEAVMPAFRDDAARTRRWPANFSLALVNAALAALLPISSVLAAEWAWQHGVGLLNQLSGWTWIAAAATLVARSLSGYVIHWLMHKAPLLWRLHRVHHLDTHLDISTTLRSHPAEVVVNFVAMGLVSISLGLTPWVLVVYELAEIVIGLVSHANIRLPDRLDRVLRLLFVTPNMHCIHHSSFQPETDSNYGGVLSFWDRLFGTYSAMPGRGYADMQIGLVEIRDARTADFLWQLASPFHRSLVEERMAKAAAAPSAEDARGAAPT